MGIGLKAESPAETCQAEFLPARFFSSSMPPKCPYQAGQLYLSTDPIVLKIYFQLKILSIENQNFVKSSILLLELEQ